jgi:hypothetical protein
MRPSYVTDLVADGRFGTWSDHSGLAIVASRQSDSGVSECRKRYGENRKDCFMNATLTRHRVRIGVLAD